MTRKKRSRAKAKGTSKRKKKKRSRRPGIVLGFLLGVILLAGLAYLLRDHIARPIAEDQASKALGCRVRIRSLATQPFSGQTVVKGLSIFSPPGFPEEGFISVGGIDLQFELMPLVGGDVLLSKVQLSKPRFNLVTALDGSNNLSMFLGRFTAAAPGEPKSVFELDKLEVVDGGIVMIDRRDPGAPMNLVFEKLSLEMGPICSVEDPGLAAGAFKLQGVLTRKGRKGFVTVEGTLAIVGDKVNFDLDVRALGIDLTGIPIESGAGTKLVVQRGVLNFRGKAVCKDNKLRCDNHVIIKELKLSSGGGLGTTALWGVPVVGSNGVLWFLDKTGGELYISFSIGGTLSEPEVDFARSFQTVIITGPQRMLQLAEQAANTVFDLGTGLGKAALTLGFTGLEKGLGVVGKTAETAVDVGKAAVGAAKGTVEGVGKVIGKLIPGKSKKKKEKQED